MTKITDTKEEPFFLYRLVKSLAHLYVLWPIEKGKTLFDRALEIFWWITMINGVVLFIGVILGTIIFYKDISSFITLIFIIFEITVLIENFYTSMLFKLKKKEFMILLNYLDKNVRKINSPHEILFKQYIRDSIPLAFSVYSLYNIIAVVFTYYQLFEPTLILPKEIWYPFKLEPFKRKIVELTQQLIYIFHSGVLHVADGIFFMSMHVARAKLAVLTEEFPFVINESQMKRCIKVHQEIIWFVSLINITSRYIVLKTVFAVGLYLTLGYCQILYQKDDVDPLLVNQFLLVITVVNFRLFFGALCANAITTVGENLRYAIPYAGQSLRVSKSMYIVIQRCQKPLIISVTGIISQYSLFYYGSFLYKTFSYFLTLKAVLGL